MKALYDGFDLVAPTTSVSMTINGPAPTILAFFLNTAIDQQNDRFRAAEGRDPSPEEAAELRAHALANVRGTVQADILKEDQGQNTCLFSTEFSLRMIADIQEWFIAHKVRQTATRCPISGYHIAEAGANPISQLAFTLANGFTYVEAYLALGMRIDDFAPNLSFFLLQRHGPRVLRPRPRRPPHLGRRDEGEVRCGRPFPEAEVPRADLRTLPARAGDGLQRHPHHSPGAHRHLRQLQQPAHQRLRRGRHHPHRGLSSRRARPSS
ncbi:Fused isobutyryl-CoA mutase [Streptomyces alboniger]